MSLLGLLDVLDGMYYNSTIVDYHTRERPALGTSVYSEVGPPWKDRQ